MSGSVVHLAGSTKSVFVAWQSLSRSVTDKTPETQGRKHYTQQGSAGPENR
jgi:hypothetical protein